MDEQEITLDYILCEIKKRMDKKNPNMLDAYFDFLMEKGIDLEDNEEKKIYLPPALKHILEDYAIKYNLIEEDSGNIDGFL